MFQQPADILKANYLHGHHASVLKSHSWRTAQNSCAYLIPHIIPTSNILDVGCGPGTITYDLASLAPAGKTIGIDPSDSVLEIARTFATERKVSNATFAVGDIYALEFPDATFDIVHAHQVLQHIADPVAALREMCRVTKPGGIIASRETDISASVWYPPSAIMDEWRDTYINAAKGSGGTPHVGRMHHVYARQAGFAKDQVTVTASAYCYGGEEDRKWWCDMWAERMTESPLRKNTVDGGWSTAEKLDAQAQKWREMAEDEDAQFTLVHGEMIVRI